MIPVLGLRALEALLGVLNVKLGFDHQTQFGIGKKITLADCGKGYELAIVEF